MFGFKMPVDVEGLGVKAKAVANVLHDHGVLGTVEGEELEREIRVFAQLVKTHGRGSQSQELEIHYPQSSVRIILETHTVDNKAYFSDIEAAYYPRINPKMDYYALNAAIHEALTEPR